jgi:antitoxin component of MazEF toxin-antitoxin module
MNAPAKHETTARLTKQGNSTGLTLPRELLQAAGLERGDSVALVADRATGTITIRKADDAYSRTLAAGRECAARYRRTLAALAK